ncbi:MAG: HIT family protein [Candidatus Thorarchaeota archaeon]|nr:HIT family protein [Candidatus Thorarchaeota archaeon]
MNDNDCLFCKMVNSEIPASVVYEDNICMAFMDIYPIAEGHCLLIPKKHYDNTLDADPMVMSYLSEKLIELNQKVNRVVEPDGILNVVANGKGAGQEIPHLHIHIIPRNHGDEFGFRYPEGYRDESTPREDLNKLAEKIRDA